MLKAKKKTKLIGLHKIHETDTGSPEVQVSLLSERISETSQHLKAHLKDNSSRRGLLRMIIRRKRLLNWLKANAPKRYQKLAQSLGLE
jgi:small subunit ribosomal protein S15